MKASVIMVTRNRASDLRQTLDAMKRVEVGGGLEAELLVVDNGSTDETPQVVRSAQLRDVPIRYVREDRPGLSRGRNRGLAETNGELIVFVDDDVRPPRGWIPALCQPMMERKASVVAGGVKLAPHLLRPWMSSMHRSYLASSEWLQPESPHSVVGANMAFAREVLTRVPGFDPDLGAGAMGFGDEELFASQLLQAGHKIYSRLDVCVEHHFHPSRLQRESWLSSAEKRGAVNAYLTYHWHHRGYRVARFRYWRALYRLRAWRGRNPAAMTPEGCQEQEMRLLYECGELRHYLSIRGRARQYELHGLVKRGVEK